MTVILGDKESSDMWLNGPPTSNFDMLLKPYEEADLTWYPVTPAMGKPSFDSPECIKEIQLKSEESKPISHFFPKKVAKKEKEQNTEDIKPKEEKDMCNLDEFDIKPKVLPPQDEPVDSKLKQQDTETLAGVGQDSTKTEHPESSPERKKVKVANDIDTSGSTKEFPGVKHELENIVGTTKPTTPAKVKGKVANDSQQKLFAYFKKN